MKKLIAMLLALAMVLSLAACGGSGNTAETKAPEANNPETPATESGEPQVEQIALKVWVPEEEIEITQAMCAAFDEAHPEWEITFDIAVVGIDEAESMLTNDPELAADVMQLPSGGLSQLNDAGLLLPITANMDAVKALYGEGALSSVTRHNAELGMDLLYGVPFALNSFFMYYNKDLYTEEEVKSLETMLAKDLGEGVYNFSFTLHDSWYLESFFYAAGCTLFGEDGTDPTNMTWNDANGLAAAEYIINLVNNPKYIEDRDGIAGSLMKDGQLGALCSGNWSYPALYEVLGDKLGACALPTIELNGKTCQLSNFADYKCFAVKSNTAQPLAAQLLAQWFCNAENQLTRYQVAGAAPCALELMDNEEMASNVSVIGLIDQSAVATPQPSISQIANYWTPVAALGEGFEKGTITMDNAQEELDKCVEQITGEVLGG